MMSGSPRSLRDVRGQVGQKSCSKLLRMIEGCTSMANCDVTLNSRCFSTGPAMTCNKRSFAIASTLFAVLLSSSTETLNARDADLASRTFAAAQTAKQKCINTCRARYRSCLSLKQMPSSQCRGVYEDCTRFTCNAVQGYPARPCRDLNRRGNRLLDEIAEVRIYPVLHSAPPI